ncbi:MAG: Fic family protein [Candidatus Omnitrophica bacterium]|nr:Fic family protein [Candidatus Omnitrophota bacterium]
MNELNNDYLINYYTKQELGFRLTPKMKLEEFWPELVKFRQAKAEFLPFKDQAGKPFWFVLTPKLQEFLHQVDSRGKDSLYSVVKEEIQAELTEQALVEEAMFSSVIEGAFSTIARARELIVEGKKPRDTSEQMVANNGRVMRYVLEQREAPCSLELMHTIQHMVTEKTLEDEAAAGRFRDGPVFVVNERRQTIYEAPPAGTVQPAMEALANWINEGEQQPFIHPILRAAIIHTYLVYVHPYVDGNGRTARAMFYWYLLKHRYEFFRYFSISSIIQETRERYYKSLKDMEDDEADMTYVLLYMAESVVRAIDVILQRITERYRRDILFANIRRQRIIMNERQTRFLRYLTISKEKRGTIAKYQKEFKVVYETARRDLAQLETLGILAKNKQGRQFIYTLNPTFLARRDEQAVA